MTRGRRLAGAAAVALALLPPAAASASVARDAHRARLGIAHGLEQHWLEPPDAARYRRDVTVALKDVSRLPKLRGRLVAAQLAQVATLPDSYTSPRALALFSQLEENLAYLETHRIPEAKTDVTGDDGVVYRFFDGQGLEFHPLASFSALNALASAQDADGTRALADALVARAIPRGRGAVWEYAFPFGSGRPPWTSGMAQAVAAQALARASSLLGEPALLREAARAFEAIRGTLVLPLGPGPWIRLYGFNREIVLNAQLQAIVSLGEYARAADDPNASALAAQLAASAQALLPRFDTGDWSLYELGGTEASRDYETLVTSLLAKLAAQTGDPFWVGAAQRFHDYLYAPAQVVEGTPPPTAYPQPLDGWLDTVAIPITLSKRASVTFAVAGKVLTYRLGAGAHVLTWTPDATVRPGTYVPQVATLDRAGNRATFRLAPVVVAWDTAPPQLTAGLDGTNASWQWSDPGTPWVELRVQLTDPAGVAAPQTFGLGRQPNAGTPTTGGTALAVPPGTWQADLTATNSAGQTATVPLGTVTSPG